MHVNKNRMSVNSIKRVHDRLKHKELSHVDQLMHSQWHLRVCNQLKETSSHSLVKCAQNQYVKWGSFSFVKFCLICL